MKKNKVLFVGSFVEKAKDGSVGGQMYACRSLIASDLNKNVEWILLDTTGDSVPPPPLSVRISKALKRVLNFIYLIITRRPSYALIFSANGTSVFEKGLMIIIANFFNVKGVFAPRGGAIVNEISHQPFLRWFLGLTLNKSKYVICQGIYFKNIFWNLTRSNNIEKFHVIPNWIDFSIYNISSIKKKETNSIDILFMGWIQEDKGIFDLFEAIKILETTKKVQFIFLGDGPSRNHFIEEVQNGVYNIECVFPGWVHGNEKINYLANADIFILPSHIEGMPNSLMEAMICGVASIATNVGAVSDLIIDGETGILIEKGNVSQIAKAISQLVDDDFLRRKYGIEGKKRILRNHSIEIATELFNKIFI
jgi:glycosyltransferase involved in cell wall biosynthesis